MSILVGLIIAFYSFAGIRKIIREEVIDVDFIVIIIFGIALLAMGV